MTTELLILLSLAVVFGPPSFWAFHTLHKRSMARWHTEQQQHAGSAARLQQRSQPQALVARASAASQVAPPVQRRQSVVVPKVSVAMKESNPHAVLPIAQVLQQLHGSTHVLIVGPTNAGKTTAARALLLQRIQAGEHVVLIDPHATADTWGGLEATGAGRDYAAITLLLEQLLAELSERYTKQSTHPAWQSQPLTIVIDEWPSIQHHCGKLAGSFLTQLAQEGRKAAMRLVMLAQSDRVESLGIHGKGDVRTNFATLLLGSKALEAHAAAGSLTWPAVLKAPQPVLVDTTGLPRMAEVVFDQARVWHKLTKPAEDGLCARLLAGAELLAPPTEAASESTNQAPPACHPDQAEEQARLNVAADQPLKLLQVDQTTPEAIQADSPAVADATQLPQDELSQLLRTLIEAGYTRTVIVNNLRFAPNRSAAFRRIRVALGETVAQDS